MMTTIMERVYIHDEDAIMVSFFVDNKFLDRQYFSSYNDAYDYMITKQMEHENGK